MTLYFPLPAPLTESELKSRFDRLVELRVRKRELTEEINHILVEVGESQPARPAWECLRCGHNWYGYSVDRPPRGCPRCHSTGWNVPPQTANARYPGDPPAPSWAEKKPKVKKARAARPLPVARPMPVIPPPKWMENLPDSTRESLLAPTRPPRMAAMRVDPVTVKFEEPEEKLILAVDSDGGIIPEDSPDAT